jgi:hypothetical protein
LALFVLAALSGMPPQIVLAQLSLNLLCQLRLHGT